MYRLSRMGTQENGSSISFPSTSQSQKSHHSLPLHEKVDLLNRIKELPPGTSNVRMCEIFGIPKSTLSRIIKSEDKIRENFKYCRYFKRYTPCKDPDVDEMLKDWFYAARAKGLMITKPILKVKADELAQKLGRTEFSASDGWLSRWQVRHNVSFKRGRGHDIIKMDVPSTRDWFARVLPELMEEYEPHSVYHAVETGLFYRAAPDTSFTFSFERSEFTKAMEQVTVLMCSNMTGQDKRKLMLIAENPKPACFKGLDVNRLPVTYRASRNAMMTAGVFDEWLSEWDARLRAEGRRVLLLVQMCSGHPPVTTLRNIRLEFLPSCPDSVAHPLHQGVVKKLKTLYRIEILRLVQSCRELNFSQQDSTEPIDVSSKITLLDAVQFLAKSWRAIKESTISAAFIRAGFEVPGLNDSDIMSFESGAEEVEDSLARLGLPKLENWEDFNSIDDAVQCMEESNPDEDLVEMVVAAKRRQLDELSSAQVEETCTAPQPWSGEEEQPAESDTPHSPDVAVDSDTTSLQDDVSEPTPVEDATLDHFIPEEPVPMVTNIEAKQCLATLQRFCTQRGLKESVCSQLDKLQDELNSFCNQEKKADIRL